MNKERRKELDRIMAAVEAAREALETAKTAFEAIATDIETVRDEEQEYYDNMAENFQNGEKGQNAEAAIGQLDEALDLANAVAELEADCDAIIQALDEAKV